MDWGQAMGGEQDHPNDVDIMDAAKLHLQQQQLHYNYNCVGSSVDVYQFSPSPNDGWDNGDIFSATNDQYLSFDNGMVTPLDGANKTEAMFSLHEPTEKDALEHMMEKSLSLKDPGILRPYLAGYNTQASRVVSACRKPDHTLEEWLASEQENGPSASLPNQLMELIRTAYKAAVKIWLAGCTSDSFAEASTYHIIGNRIKINPLRIRNRYVGENDEIVFRSAFGRMITDYIYPVWSNEELNDLVDLLGYRNARTDAIVGAPVLLLPESRELLYYKFQKETFLRPNQKTWLETNATPQDGWKERASNADAALKIIIDGQPQPFSTDFKGALHFARVVTDHYHEHFWNVEGHSGANVTDRVDEVLSKVLPRLLSKRYNAKYIDEHVH